MDSLRSVVLTNRILAAFLVGTLLWHWGLVRSLLYTGPASILGVVIVILLGLIVGSAVGLARLTPWGYYLTYALVPFATIFHGIALVPAVTNLLPQGQPRIVAVLVLNLAFLVAAIRSHRKLRAIGFPDQGSSTAAAHS